MITVATNNDYPAIIDLWEQSVRGTHRFLPEDYLQEIKALLPSIFPSVPIHIFLNEQNDIKGFLGVADQNNCKHEHLWHDALYGSQAAE